jgi:hypothetical protein
VQADIVETWDIGGTEALKSHDKQLRKNNSRGTSGQGQHQAFNQALAKNTSAAGANRATDRHFMVAMAGAREQQVGNVGAGNEQDAGYGKR